MSSSYHGSSLPSRRLYAAAHAPVRPWSAAADEPWWAVSPAHLVSTKHRYASCPRCHWSTMDPSHATLSACRAPSPPFSHWKINLRKHYSLQFCTLVPIFVVNQPVAPQAPGILKLGPLTSITKCRMVLSAPKLHSSPCKLPKLCICPYLLIPMSSGAL
jgi:hypothetical protein